jgi:hypothetical protein
MYTICVSMTSSIIIFSYYLRSLNWFHLSTIKIVRVYASFLSASHQFHKFTIILGILIEGLKYKVYKCKISNTFVVLCHLGLRVSHLTSLSKILNIVRKP